MARKSYLECDAATCSNRSDEGEETAQWTDVTIKKGQRTLVYDLCPDCTRQIGVIILGADAYAKPLTGPAAIMSGPRNGPYR